MTADDIDAIRNANREIRAFLARATLLEREVPYRALDGLSGVAEAVEQAGRSLAASPRNLSLDGSAKGALTEYTENLRRLRESLARLQTGLTGRRADLQTRLAKAQAALAWVTSLKQTVEPR